MKTKRIAQLIVALAVWSSSQVRSQEILKCIDSVGRVTYTNEACEPKAKARQLPAPSAERARSAVTEAVTNRPEKVQNASKAPVVAQKSDKDRRYDEAVAILERQYPVLNPASPTYDSRLIAEVLARKARYVERGLAPDNAVRSAVADSMPPITKDPAPEPPKRWEWMSPSEQLLGAIPGGLLNAFAKSLLLLPIILFAAWLWRRSRTAARHAVRVVRTASATDLAIAAGSATTKVQGRASNIAAAFRSGRREER